MPVLQHEFHLPVKQDSEIAALFPELEEGGLPYGGLEPYWDHAADCKDCGRCLAEFNDKRKFSVDLDVSQFRPDELRLSLDEHRLTVVGRQDNIRENAQEKRSFVKVWTLPPDIEEDNMQSSLSSDGVLHIEGPKIESPKPRRGSQEHRRLPGFVQADTTDRFNFPNEPWSP